MAVFLRQCHFQDLPFLSQIAEKLSMKLSMNKEKHSLRNFAALQSGGATQEIPPYLKHYFLIQKRANFENCIASEKMALEIKMPSSTSLFLVSFCWKKECSTHQCTHYCYLL